MPRSVSVPRMFAQIRVALEHACEVEQLPPDYLDLADQERRACLQSLLRRSDVALVAGVVSRRRLAEVFASRPHDSFPIVYLPVGELPRGAPNFRNVFPLFHSRDLILVNCSADARIIENLTRSCRARTVQVPLGVDTRVFRPPGPGERARTRAALGLAEDDVLLTYAGRVCAEKNVHGALAAFQIVAARNPRLHLLIVGPLRDEYFPEFQTGPFSMGALLRRQLALVPQVKDRVHFTRFSVEEAGAGVARLCGASDFFINLTLTHDECFGYSAVEAMSCGLPVVATYWGGQQDTIEDGVTGFHVDTAISQTGIRFDLHQAVRACEALASSPALRRRMGRAARRRVKTLFSEERFRDLLCAVVTNAARTRASRARVNRWSSQGSRFAARFAVPADDHEPDVRAGTPLARIPVYDGPQAYSLYRALIGPYCRGPVRGPADLDAVLFLRSPFLRLRGRTVLCDDPLWPGRHRLPDLLSARVIEALQSRSFLTVRDLARTLALTPSALVPTLRSLCRHGLVVASSLRGPAPETDRSALVA